MTSNINSGQIVKITKQTKSRKLFGTVRKQAENKKAQGHVVPLYSVLTIRLRSLMIKNFSDET